MGFESFRVDLRGDEFTSEQINDWLRRQRGARPDDDATRVRGSKYFVIDDGRHVFEIETCDAPVRVSCRFTLCHPPSADGAFLSLIRGLMKRFDMSVHAHCGSDGAPRKFSFAEFAEFEAVTRKEMTASRRGWIDMFGSRQMAATTAQAHAQFILPRSEPVAH